MRTDNLFMANKSNIHLANPNTCTGCGACASVCPKGCISMVEDREGFVQPKIDAETCIGCHKCEKTCPVLTKILPRSEDGFEQIGYAAKNKNLKERLISSSGSVFPVLAKWILQNGGLVVGVGYDDKFEAVYREIDRAEDLYLVQGSKYIQCRPDRGVFSGIKANLETGRWVLFSGLACQVEGLLNYLGKGYDTLVCVDLICMGVPSPRVWRKYLAWKFEGEKILSVNFKEKSIGWNRFCFYVKTDHREFRELGMQNQYLQTMFKTYNMRESCFGCPFKQRFRKADLTLADCWGVSQQVGDIDDNKGLSSIVIHTSKGLDIWNNVSDQLDYREVLVDSIIAGNRNMIENKQKNRIGKWMFYRVLLYAPNGWVFAIMGRYKKTFVGRVINKMKKLLKKI